MHFIEPYQILCQLTKIFCRYGRLNINGTILSKRRLIELVEGRSPEGCNKGKYVKGWDDPRLFTLVGLRRRGIPPGAILSFVNELGVTKAVTTIDIKRFEQSVRSYLETTVPRLMLIPDPIPIILDNLPDDYEEMVELPYSKDPSYGVCIVNSLSTGFTIFLYN